MRVSITMAAPLSAWYWSTACPMAFWVNHCRSRSMVVRRGAPSRGCLSVLSRSGMRTPLLDEDCQVASPSVPASCLSKVRSKPPSGSSVPM